MKKHIKRSLKIVTCSLLLLLLAVPLLGCKSSNSEEDEIMGTFYTLQEAYDAGFLTVDDLKSIAYYHHDGMDLVKKDGTELEIGAGFTKEDEWKFVPSNYVPLPKNPRDLTTETERGIRKTELKYWRERMTSVTCSLNDIYIHKYLGTYNDYVSVVPVNKSVGYVTINHPVIPLEVAGVLFYFRRGNINVQPTYPSYPIKVWISK